jgi:hypothetical protein
MKLKAQSVEPDGGCGEADESKRSLFVVRIHLTNLRFVLRFVRRWRRRGGRDC